MDKFEKSFQKALAATRNRSPRNRNSQKITSKIHSLELDKIRWKEHAPLSAPWLGERIELKGNRPKNTYANIGRDRVIQILKEAGLPPRPPRPGYVTFVQDMVKGHQGMWTEAKVPSIEIENKAGKFIIRKRWY